MDAKRFQSETREKLSNEGKQWLDEVLVNLQKEMEKRLSEPDGVDLELEQQGFKNFAFDSHVDVYWNEVNGTVPLYTLNILDLFSIVLTPDFKDLTSSEGRTQAIKIMGKLNEYWGENTEVRTKRINEFKDNMSTIRDMFMNKVGIEIIMFFNDIIEYLPKIPIDDE